MRRNAHLVATPMDTTWNHNDSPNWERLGFLAAACDMLGSTPEWRDDDGYDHRIMAAAVHPERDCVAWVECRQITVTRKGQAWLDIEYRLKSRNNGEPAIDWVVETYNPFFGCDVGYMAWHGEHIVLAYREKHRTYIASAAAGESVRLAEAADDWRVVGDVIEFCRWRSDQVERLSLPSLLALPALTGAEAEATGLLWT